MAPLFARFLLTRVTRLALLMLPAMTACRTSATPTDTPSLPVVPVELATATPQGATDAVVVTGRYAARDEVVLAFKTGGVVARVLVDEGAVVRRGQRLAALDLREMDAVVAGARAAMEKAQRDAERLARLAADSVATRAQAQDAATALDAARAALVQAQVNREYGDLTAPEDGVIQQRLLAPGAMAAPGQPVLLLGGARRGAVVRAGLPDRDAVRVRVGDAATVRFAAVDGTPLVGRVLLVGRSADPRTGTYPVEVAVTGADALPLGLVGEVRIVPAAPSAAGATRATASRHEGSVAVPMAAVLEPDGDSATVLVMASPRDTVPQPRRVRLLGADGDDARLAGVAPGTLVVARGAAYVTPGTVVRVVAPGSAPGAATAQPEPRP
jgi:RND family efflux transporter MFP subunit